MKVLIAFAIFICVFVPAFSQDTNVPVYRELSDSMGSSISSSTSTLANFDLLMMNNDNFVTYTTYMGQYNTLVNSLRESEARLNKLIKANAIESRRKDERDNYERLLKRLQAVKSEFDGWMQSIR